MRQRGAPRTEVMHPFGNLSHPGSEERESASTPGLFLAGRTRMLRLRCHLSYIMTPVFLLGDTGSCARCARCARCFLKIFVQVCTVFSKLFCPVCRCARSFQKLFCQGMCTPKLFQTGLHPAQISESFSNRPAQVHRTCVNRPAHLHTGSKNHLAHRAQGALFPVKSH